MTQSNFKGVALRAALLALTGISPCAAADKPIVHHHFVKSATTAAFSPSGDFIAVVNDKRIWVFDTATLEQISEMVDYSTSTMIGNSSTVSVSAIPWNLSPKM